MIVVVGNPAWRAEEPGAPAGRAAGVALAAAQAGVGVELVGRAGDDPAGDALVLALSHAGVGHVALLRDPARATPVIASDQADDAVAPPPVGPTGRAVPSQPVLDPEDVALGLRYLGGFSVLVVTDDTPAGVIPECIAAAEYTGARLVILTRAPEDVPGRLPADATVLAAPAGEGEAFTRMVGAYAAALDRGASPDAAFSTATSGGWEQPVA